MVVPKIQSAHNSEARNIINKAIETINLYGETIQDLVAEGQLTEEQYANLITTINGLVKSGYINEQDLTQNLRNEIKSKRDKFKDITLNDIDENFLAALQGTATFNLESTPRDYSVSPIKTTFMERTENLFEKYEKGMAILAPAAGGEWSVVSEADGRMAIIPIEPSTQYFVRKFDASERFRVGLVSTSEVVDGTVISTEIINSPNGMEASFTSGADDTFMLVHVSNNSEEPRINVTQEKDSQSYILPFKISDEIIPRKKTEFDDLSNDFKKKIHHLGSVELGSFVSGALTYANGTLYENSTRVTSAFIFVEEGYTVSLADESSLDFFLVFNYDQDKNFIDRSGSSYITTYTTQHKGYIRVVGAYSDDREILSDTLGDEIVLSANNAEYSDPLNTYIKNWVLGGISFLEGNEGTIYNNVKRSTSPFIKLGKGESLVVEDAQLSGIYVVRYDDAGNYIDNLGEYLSQYIATAQENIRVTVKYKDDRDIELSSLNGAVLKKHSIYSEVEDNDEGSVIAKTYYLNGFFNNDFDVTSLNLEDVSEESPTPLTGKTITDVYDIYDTIAANHPNRVEKNTLGYATSNDGTEMTEYPIHQYHFKLGELTGINRAEKPKILLFTGVHGNEKATVWATAKVFEEMYRKSKNVDKVLKDFRQNIEFVVVPICNPYGFDNNRRYNARSVDLNRNFEYLWEGTTHAYKGDSPLSEFESQAMNDAMLTHKDAFAFVDYHNWNTNGTNEYITYVNGPSKDFHGAYRSAIDKLSDEWRYDYTFLDQTENKVYGWGVNDEIPVTYAQAHFIHGIKLSGIIETQTFFTTENSLLYSPSVISMTTELLVEHLQSLIRNFAK